MRRSRSVRVRITALATAIVAFALVLASVALVVSLQNTLAGRARAEATQLVSQTATYVRTGDRVPNDLTARALRAGIILEVRDSSGTPQTLIPDVMERRFQVYASTVVPNEPVPAPFAEQNTAVESGDRGGVVIRRIDANDNIIVSETVATPEGQQLITAVTPLAEVALSVDPVVQALKFGTPTLIALVGLVTWWMTGRALRPIEDLRAQAETISHTTLHDRLPVPSTGDEVARLATTLNDMLARIDIASRRQREFVSDASHELRSPITSMNTALEVASLHPASTTVPMLSAELLRETSRMQKLVNGLLTLARLEDGEFSALVPIDLGPIITEVTGEAASELMVEADASQFEAALRNLVDNARRHATSEVDVSILRSETDVTIVVDDDGPGIPTEERERIFERFTRLDEGRSRSDGGVGIGLALVRRIAARHHGTVSVTDSPLGGARFSLTLPLRQPTLDDRASHQ